ncbi:hypothetical protein C3L33_10562, partial [Rhododendron williamsianum]
MAKKGCEDLPDECWELIFNKLHQLHHSLLESLSLSCKRFLSLTNALRTHLTIVHPRVHPVSTLLNRFPNLNSIHLSCSQDRDTFDPCSFDGPTPHLTLEPLDLQRMTIEVAAANLNLESLSFSGTQLHLESLRILGSRMKNLKVLMCSDLRTLRDLELLAIADSMPCLEDLDISYPVNDFGWEDDEFDTRSPSEVGVTDTGIEVLSSKLRNIALRDCSFTNYGIEFVMRNSPNLSSLSVQGIEFGELDEHSLCCARNITTLVIDSSSVPDESLHLLVKAGFPLKSIHLDLIPCIPSFTFLEVLDVSHCKGITEEGIADFLKSGSKIRKLRIVGCRGIKNIGNGFELSDLEILGAARSGINDEGLTNPSKDDEDEFTFVRVLLSLFMFPMAQSLRHVFAENSIDRVMALDFVGIL